MTKKAEAPAAAAVETDEQPGETGKDDLKVEVVDEILLTPRVKPSKFKLRFSPYAWTKIRWIRDYCRSEIAGFGISSVEDPLYMDDFRTIKQTASSGHFAFDDDALGDHLAAMFEEGKHPGECMRLWVHTHPGDHFASPSSHDEETFTDAFGNADWAMMIIVDEGDHVYSRMSIKTGSSRLQMAVPNSVVCQPPFKGVDESTAAEWKREADENISREPAQATLVRQGETRLPVRQQRHDQRHYQPMDPNPFPDGYDPNYARGLFASQGQAVSEWENVETILMGEERVVEITTNKGSDDVLVHLSNAWLLYDPDVTPKCREGTTIAGAREIADVPPRRCGELEWNIDEKSGVPVPTYVSEVVDGYVTYFEGSEVDDEAKAVKARIDATIAEEDEEDDIEIETIEEVRVGSDWP